MGLALRLSGTPSLAAAGAGRETIARLRATDVHLVAEVERAARLRSIGGTVPAWLDGLDAVDARLGTALAMPISDPDATTSGPRPGRSSPRAARSDAATRSVTPAGRPHVVGRRQISFDRPVPVRGSHNALVTDLRPHPAGGRSEPAGASTDGGTTTPPTPPTTGPAELRPPRRTAAATPVEVARDEFPLAEAVRAMTARGPNGRRAIRTASSPGPLIASHGDPGRSGDVPGPRSDRPRPDGSAPTATPIPAWVPAPARALGRSAGTPGGRVRSLADLAERLGGGSSGAPARSGDGAVPTGASEAMTRAPSVPNVPPGALHHVPAAGSTVDRPGRHEAVPDDLRDPSGAIFLPDRLADLVGRATADQARREGVDLDGVFA